MYTRKELKVIHCQDRLDALMERWKKERTNKGFKTKLKRAFKNWSDANLEFMKELDT